MKVEDSVGASRWFGCQLQERKDPMPTGLLGSLLFMIFSAVRIEVASAIESKSHQNHLLGALQPLSS